MKLIRSVIGLSGAALLALAAVTGAAPQHHSVDDNNPDLIEIRHYRLTMDKVEKLAATTDTVNKTLAADPALRKQVMGDTDKDDNDTITQKALKIDTKYPQFAAVVHQHGLSTREYIVASIAFMNDVMVVGMKRQGAIKTYPPNAITPENATFVEQNFDKLTELGKKMTPPDQGDQN